jgi:hypothetical protein
MQRQRDRGRETEAETEAERQSLCSAQKPTLPCDELVCIVSFARDCNRERVRETHFGICCELLDL